MGTLGEKAGPLISLELNFSGECIIKMNPRVSQRLNAKNDLKAVLKHMGPKQLHSLENKLTFQVKQQTEVISQSRNSFLEIFTSDPEQTSPSTSQFLIFSNFLKMLHS